ncbi:hypothetical protein MKX03_002301 [Papaver bracteatum]|nr:hypothetical protein MKX03_002301 [Papaver bracteatum]
MWLATMRSLPRASQKACGATDGYHLKLKLILYDNSHLGSLQRVEWRIISHHLHGIELRKFQKMLLSLTTKIASLPRKPLQACDKGEYAALDQSLAWSNHMLDQIQRSVELDNSNGVSNIVNTLPLKWTAIKHSMLIFSFHKCPPFNTGKYLQLQIKPCTQRKYHTLSHVSHLSWVF